MKTATPQKPSCLQATSAPSANSARAKKAPASKQEAIRLTPLQIAIESVARRNGLYIIPEALVNEWDKEGLELSVPPEANIFREGHRHGISQAINHIIMAIQDVRFYQRYRPHNKIL